MNEQAQIEQTEITDEALMQICDDIDTYLMNGILDSKIHPSNYAAIVVSRLVSMSQALSQEATMIQLFQAAQHTLIETVQGTANNGTIH
jgi:hypothetical protein